VSQTNLGGDPIRLVAAVGPLFVFFAAVQMVVNGCCLRQVGRKTPAMGYCSRSSPRFAERKSETFLF